MKPKLSIVLLLLLILSFGLFLRYRAKVGSSAEKTKMKINFVFPDKDGVIGVTEDTPANNVRVLLTAVWAYEAKYNSLPPSLSSLGPPSTGKEANRDGANLIDPRLALGSKNGYVFHYVPNANSGSFFITADPSGNGSPDSLHFFSNQNAMVRVESGRAATDSSRLYQADN